LSATGSRTAPIRCFLTKSAGNDSVEHIGHNGGTVNRKSPPRLAFRKQHQEYRNKNDAENRELIGCSQNCRTVPFKSSWRQWAFAGYWTCNGILTSVVCLAQKPSDLLQKK
jgi:hypothetical protein